MTALRIATLNCLNLALPGSLIYDGWPAYSGDEYLAKTQWLGAMFDRLAADFVLVQEVFHESALADAVRQTAAQGRGWSLSVPRADDRNTRPRSGLLWRAPWQPVLESIAELPPGCAVPVPERADHVAFSRPLLRARVPLMLPDGGSTELTLLNVHLKSRRPEYVDGEDRDDPRSEARAQLRALIMRAAEAAALRRIVVDTMRGNHRPLIVAGDFNDEPNAVTTQIVADTSWKRDDGPQRDCTLFNAFDVEQRTSRARGRDVAFTIVHGGEPERVDHVLVSEQFAAHSRHAIGQVTSVEVLNDHLAERGRRWPAAARDALDPGRILSDHAAVVVTIILGEAEAGRGAGSAQ